MTGISKYLGICMDHSSAHLMEYEDGNNETKTIESKFTHLVKEQTLSKSENLMHHKEQHQQAEYYKKLGETIRNYKHVLLFGPTTAKTELLNVLKADHNFVNIHIVVKESDRMTENQQHAFLKDYFVKQL